MGFTKEKVMAAHSKLGFDPYSEAILKNKALRHEIGQGEVTDQTRAMRELEREYNELRAVVDKQGKSNTNLKLAVAHLSLLSLLCISRL